MWNPSKLAALSLLTLALAACGQSGSTPGANTSTSGAKPLRIQPICPIDDPGQVLPDGCGGPTDPPVDPPPSTSGLQLHSFAELQAKADRLGVSLDEAASPFIEDVSASATGLSALSYPTGTSAPQEFIDRLYQGTPTILTGTLPAPQTGNAGCQDIPHDVTSPASQGLLSFSEFPGVLYAGALYQGNSAPGGVGSLNDLPVDSSKRNPLTIYTDTPGITPQYNVQPNPADVYNATGNLIASAASRLGADQPDNVYFEVITASSAREAALKLKMDVSAFGGSLSASLDSSSNSSNSSVYVVFKQTLFNVLVNDVGGASAFQKLFNANLGVGDLQTLGDRNLLGYDNLPTYIRSVSYGRALIVRYSSSKDVNELKAALDAKYGKISGGVSEYQKRILDNSDLEVLAYGGPYEINKEAFKQDGWKTYLDRTNIPLSTLKPISYGLSFWDGRRVQMSHVFRYLEHVCASRPSKIEVKIENRRGDTVLYVRDAAGVEREAVRLDDDQSERVFDLTPYLDGQDDNIRVSSIINRYGLFSSSERDAKVTFFVDGQPFTGYPAAPAEDSCSQCHSADLANYTANKANGKLLRR